ncbi:large conductance mechanosensitive channel protein MscL [Cellulomonas chengniuliangii]|uniref:Large-conductance mechanosensitive channel n=1 Tax=Cellulomonas chengniuliangii TaxID=2968084 RepID=A0ABY5L0V3_9CELL|nr:large conductance mechanosensitive channel protein MscL [Cellulomonas chengniuliangii]MCC2307170.1 large conductance mechanosensitive channel protein MscL [Cellulomonas chengniuliangii]MCC2317933.1 large conductance mechanosensitive channel protein MscL [Cellulomonas chengniuliangii]UUI76034.1 large conductance mechanosensitive channel protein MscL [Cellulomonas chengniuliangii]
MKSVLTGFKDFVARGNAIELAVAVVIGAAFNTFVSSLVEGFIGPLIGSIFGGTDLSGLWKFTILGGEYKFGLVADAALQLLITAAALYFVIVLPLNHLAKRRRAGLEDEPAAPPEDLLVLQEIRDLLAQRVTPAVRNDAGSAPRA